MQSRLLKLQLESVCKLVDCAAMPLLPATPFLETLIPLTILLRLESIFDAVTNLQQHRQPPTCPSCLAAHKGLDATVQGQDLTPLLRSASLMALTLICRTKGCAGSNSSLLMDASEPAAPSAPAEACSLAEIPAAIGSEAVQYDSPTAASVGTWVQAAVQQNAGAACPQPTSMLSAMQRWHIVHAAHCTVWVGDWLLDLDDQK